MAVAEHRPRNGGRTEISKMHVWASRQLLIGNPMHSRIAVVTKRPMWPRWKRGAPHAAAITAMRKGASHHKTPCSTRSRTQGRSITTLDARMACSPRRHYLSGGELCEPLSTEATAFHRLQHTCA